MCTWINNRRRPEAFCTFALLSDCEKKTSRSQNRRASWPHRAHVDIQHRMLTVSRRFFVQNLAFRTGDANPLYSHEEALIRTGFRLVIELRYFSVTLPKLNVLRANSGAVSERTGTDESAPIPRIRDEQTLSIKMGIEFCEAVACIPHRARPAAETGGYHPQIVTQMFVALFDVVSNFAAFKIRNRPVGNSPPSHPLPFLQLNYLVGQNIRLGHAGGPL